MYPIQLIIIPVVICYLFATGILDYILYLLNVLQRTGGIGVTGKHDCAYNSQ